jgi:threonylcarbamoyladenosine tRNA methylthiotransferase MtaB
VDDCGLTFLHVFPYSRRAGTPAARMPQVAGREVKDRAARLRAKGSAALTHYLQSQVGQDVELLMERNGLGRTPGFAEMALDSTAGTGEVLSARVTRSDGLRLQGERLAPKCDQ